MPHLEHAPALALPLFGTVSGFDPYEDVGDAARGAAADLTALVDRHRGRMPAPLAAALAAVAFRLADAAGPASLPDEWPAADRPVR